MGSQIKRWPCLEYLYVHYNHSSINWWPSLYPSFHLWIKSVYYWYFLWKKVTIVRLGGKWSIYEPFYIFLYISYEFQWWFLMSCLWISFCKGMVEKTDVDGIVGLNNFEVKHGYYNWWETILFEYIDEGSNLLIDWDLISDFFESALWKYGFLE